MVLVFGFSVPLENQQSVNKISHKTRCFHCGTNYWGFGMVMDMTMFIYLVLME